MGSTDTISICRRGLLSALIIAPFFFSGCSIFGPSDRYEYTPIKYDGSKGSNVLKTAMTQYGKAYKYGKSDPSEGFDCSGLIFWAYEQNGIHVPRNTYGQSKAGRWVSARNTKQGDIVVFRIGRRLHTGLVADKGRFLHAPSSGNYIRMESLRNRYWKPKIIGYRRIV